MRGWGQADDKELGVGVAEARNGLRPIFPIPKRRAFFGPDSLPPVDESGALPAFYDLGVKLLKRVHR
jgi:hypothetical protein